MHPYPRNCIAREEIGRTEHKGIPGRGCPLEQRMSLPPRTWLPHGEVTVAGGESEGKLCWKNPLDIRLEIPKNLAGLSERGRGEDPADGRSP